MYTSNPLAAVSTEDLEEQFEAQVNALNVAIRNGNAPRASRLQSAMRVTEAELSRRGVEVGGLDPVRA